MIYDKVSNNIMVIYVTYNLQGKLDVILLLNYGGFTQGNLDIFCLYDKGKYGPKLRTFSEISYTFRLQTRKKEIINDQINVIFS